MEETARFRPSVSSALLACVDGVEVVGNGSAMPSRSTVSVRRRAGDQRGLTVLNLVGADFDTEGNAVEFVFVYLIRDCGVRGRQVRPGRRPRPFGGEVGGVVMTSSLLSSCQIGTTTT